jgi:hypothetical protein
MPLRRLFGGGPATKNLGEAEALERSQSNRAALSAAINNAVTASIANQPANTARSYAKAQKLWREFCADRQFDDGVLVSEEKLVLWLQEVVLQLRIPDKLTGKRKGDAVNPAVLRQKRRKGKGLAIDPQIKQLAEGLEMPIEELLEELPAMLADDKAVEVGEGDEEGVSAIREGEVIDRFLKAGTVDSYIAAVLQLYKGPASAGPQHPPAPSGRRPQRHCQADQGGAGLAGSGGLCGPWGRRHQCRLQ